MRNKIIKATLIFGIFLLAGCGNINNDAKTEDARQSVTDTLSADNEKIIYIASVSTSSRTIDRYFNEQNGNVSDKSIALSEQCAFYDSKGQNLDLVQTARLVREHYESSSAGLKCRVVLNNGLATKIYIV